MRILLTLLASCVLATAAPFGFNANQMVARTNLVGWFTFNSTNANGNFPDSSGNGYIGSNSNGIPLGAGVIGSAAILNGTSQFISIPTNVLNLNSFTISFWVYITNTPLEMIITKGDDTLSNNNLTLRVYFQSALGLTFDMFSGITRGFIGKQIPVNKNYFMTYTYDGTTATCYTNGVSFGSFASGAPNLNSSNILVGCRYSSSSLNGFTPGIIDDLRFWNRALTAAEIASMCYTTNGVTYPVPGK